MNKGLISIKPEHVKNIIQGNKTVEIRTRRLNLPVGSILWVYSTLPTGCIEVVVEIDFIITLSPDLIWKKYHIEMCVSKELFDEYTKGKKLVSAIGFKNIKKTDKALCLNTLRSFDENFMPPQFFIKLTPDKKISQAFI